MAIAAEGILPLLTDNLSQYRIGASRKMTFDTLKYGPSMCGYTNGSSY